MLKALLRHPRWREVSPEICEPEAGYHIFFVETSTNLLSTLQFSLFCSHLIYEVVSFLDILSFSTFASFERFSSTHLDSISPKMTASQNANVLHCWLIWQCPLRSQYTGSIAQWGSVLFNLGRCFKNKRF